MYHNTLLPDAAKASFCGYQGCKSLWGVMQSCGAVALDSTGADISSTIVAVDVTPCKAGAACPACDITYAEAGLCLPGPYLYLYR